MNHYYFLSTLLPPLTWEGPIEIEFDELISLFFINLRREDYEQIVKLRRLHDIYNLRSLWLNAPLSPYGNFSANALQEAVATQTGLPEYCLDFLQQYLEVDGRLKHFSRLLFLYFRHEVEDANAITKKYIEFEHGVAVVKAALRAKTLHRDLQAEMLFATPDHPVIMDTLAQRDHLEYQPPQGYERVKELYLTYRDDPVALYRAMAEWRFNLFEEWKTHLFSFEGIVVYLLQLIEKEQVKRIQQ